MGKVFYRTTAMILLGLVGLAAPAAAAGAICLDKARGNLTLLFATDLTDAEIVLGKLAARLVPVLGLIVCAAPVLALATLFGGVDPVDADRGPARGARLRRLRLHAGADAVGLGPEDARGAAGDLRLRHPLPAVGADLGGPPDDAALAWRPAWLPGVLGPVPYNPVFLVLAALGGSPPGMRPVTLGTQATFLGLGLAASAVLVGAATWRIRAVVIRQLGRGERVPRRRTWRRGRSGGSTSIGSAGGPGAGPARLLSAGRGQPVARRQPGALARVPAEAAVALVLRRLGDLRRALRRVQPLCDRPG